MGCVEVWLVLMCGLWLVVGSDVPQGGRVMGGPRLSLGARAARDCARGSHVTCRLAAPRRRRMARRCPARPWRAGLRILRSAESGGTSMAHLHTSSALIAYALVVINIAEMGDAPSSFDAPRSTSAQKHQPPLSNREWMRATLALSIICASDTEAQTANAKSRSERGRAGIHTRHPKWR